MRKCLSAGIFALAVFLFMAAPALAQDTSNVRLVGDYPYGVNYAAAFFEVGANDYSLISSGKMLIAVNVTAPASPVKAGELMLPDIILGMVVSGNHAYVAAGASGLRVIDLSNPAALAEVGSLNSPGPANRVVVSGSYAYVAADSGVQVVNISIPSSPVQAGKYSNYTFLGATEVAVSGNYAYAVAPHQLRILDISDPSSIDSVGIVDLLGWGGCWGTGVALSGSYAYVSVADSGLWVVNVSNPAAPSKVGSCNTPGTAYNVTAAGSYAHVSDGTWGMQTVNCSTPSAPWIEGYLGGAGETYDLIVTTYYIYAAVNGCGLQIIENLGPDIPQEIGVYNCPGRAAYVSVSGDYAYISHELFGLEVLDVSDPSDPRHLSYFRPFITGLDPHRMTVSGNYGYLAEGYGGLRILNVSNPASITQAGQYNTTGYTYDVAIRDTLVFVADSAAGLRVIKVSNPSSPSEIGFINTAGGYTRAVALYGNYAILAEDFGGIKVINISNPASPAQVASLNPYPAYDAVDVKVKGNYAYVAWSRAGLRAVDISTPNSPVIVDSVKQSGYSYNSVEISGDYLYAGIWEYGLKVYNISDPLNVTEVARYADPWYTSDVAVSGGYSYLTTSGIDLMVLQHYGPPAPGLLAPADNAWQGAAAFHFSWSASKRAKDSPVFYVVKAYALPDTLNPVLVDTTNLTADTLTVTTEGRYAWRVEAHDQAGNPPGISGLWRFGYDKTPPTAVNLTGPADSLITNQNSVAFGWRSCTDAVSGLKEYALVYALDPGFSSGLAETTLTDTSLTLSLADSNYYWMVEARDTSGNVNVSPARYLTVDATDPLIPALLTPADNSWQTSGTAICTWGAVSKLGKASEVRYMVQLDTANYFPGPMYEDTTAVLSDTFNLVEGKYYWRVAAFDLAGNGGPCSGTRMFGIDHTVPDIQYVLALSDDPSAPYGPYEVTSLVYDLSGVKAAYLFKQINGGTWDSTAMFAAADSLRDSIPEQTVATNETLSVSYYLKVTDLLDQSSTSSTYSFKVLGPTGVEGNPSQALPAVFALNGAWPNPSMGRTTFKYQLPRSCNVSLTVYNVAGQAVKRFDLGTKPAGYHDVNWNGSRMTAGVYIYRLQAGEYSATRKLVVLK